MAVTGGLFKCRLGGLRYGRLVSKLIDMPVYLMLLLQQYAA